MEHKLKKVRIFDQKIIEVANRIICHWRVWNTVYPISIWRLFEELKSNPEEHEDTDDEEPDSEDEKDTHVFTEDEDVSDELSEEGDDDFFEESEFNADLVDQLYPWKGSKASMFEDVELLTEELK